MVSCSLVNAAKLVFAMIMSPLIKINQSTYWSDFYPCTLCRWGNDFVSYGVRFRPVLRLGRRETTFYGAEPVLDVALARELNLFISHFIRNHHAFSLKFLREAHQILLLIKCLYQLLHLFCFYLS